MSEESWSQADRMVRLEGWGCVSPTYRCDVEFLIRPMQATCNMHLAQSGVYCLRILLSDVNSLSFSFPFLPLSSSMRKWLGTWVLEQ